MRFMLAAAVAALAFVVAPSAGAEVLTAEAQSLASGVRFTWVASYDTATNNLNLTCTMVSADTGENVAPSASTVATITVVLANSQERTLDCVPIMNLGTQTDKVNLKVSSSGRWSGFELHTLFRP